MAVILMFLKHSGVHTTQIYLKPKTNNQWCILDIFFYGGGSF